VTEAVVDLLEVVDVQHQQGEFAVITSHALELELELERLQEPATRREPRQRVDGCCHLQIGDQADGVRDVADDRGRLDSPLEHDLRDRDLDRKLVTVATNSVDIRPLLHATRAYR